MKSSEVKSSQVKSSQVRWSEVKWGEVKWSELKRSEIKRSEIKWLDRTIAQMPSVILLVLFAVVAAVKVAAADKGMALLVKDPGPPGPGIVFPFFEPSMLYSKDLQQLCTVPLPCIVLVRSSKFLHSRCSADWYWIWIGEERSEVINRKIGDRSDRSIHRG